MTLNAQAQVQCSADVLIYRSNNRDQVALYYRERHDPMGDTVTMRIFCVFQRGQIASHISLRSFLFFSFLFILADLKAALRARAPHGLGCPPLNTIRT